MENFNDSIESGSVDVVSETVQTQQLEDAISEKNAVEGISNSENEQISEESEKVETSEQKENDQFSSKFAALSRREKSLRQKESEIDAKLAQLEEKLNSLNEPKEEEVKPEEPKQLPLEYRLKANPLETLNELGLSYEKLTDMVLNDGKLPTEMKMDLMKSELEDKYKNELESLRNEILEDKKQREEQQYNQVIQNFKEDLTGFVNTTEDYELIRANDAVDLVYQVIEEQYNETGRILSNKEAADQVESYLFEEAQKLLKLKKLGFKEEPKQEIVTERKSEPSMTLSNSHTSQVPNRHERKLSRDESLAEVAKLLKWDE